MPSVATMICVLIVIQLVVYVVAVLWLVLFGWVADQLSRPADHLRQFSRPER
ncbi:hypothetical protein [Kribbella sp. NBC_00889]|uniref:hypothetical protein n=1 Tax=Kribbella sp. NBC_00889 TaxID=2975974 RepID=UPI00386D0AEE|nr:hypothetical protein OG817_08800 [Kribbella sp. NBC_00889]